MPFLTISPIRPSAAARNSVSATPNPWECLAVISAAIAWVPHFGLRAMASSASFAYRSTEVRKSEIASRRLHTEIVNCPT